MKQFLTFLVLLITLSSQAQQKLTVKSSSGSFSGGSYTQSVFPSQKRVFDVKNYGVKADGKYVYDAQIGSGTTTLTSTTASFTSADVGKYFELYTTNFGALQIHGTITAVISSIQVTLSTTATSATMYGRFLYGSDDTQAMQAAIDTADIAGGGKIIGDGIMLIAGGLKTSNPRFPSAPAYDNQLMIPYYVAGDSIGDRQYKTLSFEGMTIPPMGYLWTTTPPTAGWIWKSCIYTTTGLRPCMIGGPSDNLKTDYSNWHMTNVRCDFNKIIFRGQASPNLMLLDNGTVVSGNVTNCAFDADDQIQNAAEPTDSRGIGLRMPLEGNLILNKVENVWISGQYTGLIPGEGTQVDYAFIYGCEQEGQFWAENYPPVFGYMLGSWNKYGWKWVGTNHVEMPLYQTEHKGTGNPGVTWQQRVYDFYEATPGLASGHIKFFEVLGAYGEEHQLLTNIAATSPIIFTAYNATPTIYPSRDTTIAGTGTYTDVAGSQFYTDLSGDYDMQVKGTLKFTGTTGAVSVSEQLLYWPLGAAGWLVVPNSERLVYADGNLASDKTVTFNHATQVRFIASKKVAAAMKLQVKATYTGGTLTVLGGTTTPGGTTITRKPL